MPDATPATSSSPSSDDSQYRGYTIAVTPRKDHDDLWDFDYTIAPVDGKGQPRQRSNTAGGHASEAIALQSGIEVARIEIDNLLAMKP